MSPKGPASRGFSAIAEILVHIKQ